MVGKKLGKYEIVAHLGRGGMAEVYKAVQPEIERFVAIKVMHCHLTDSEELVVRFLREARAIGRLHHPNIVQIIDADRTKVNARDSAEPTYYYMVMNYIEGETLGHYLQNHPPLMVEEVLHIGLQLAEVLAYAHEQGMIHRDIKPTNILLRNGSPYDPILTDFGLARLCDDQSAGLTVNGSMIGTPTYMSPEAIRGEPCDVQSDIYSLGTVLYELFTGRPPYVANTPYSMMMKLANEPLPPPRSLNPTLPTEVEAMLTKALAKAPTDRYADANALHVALKEVQQVLASPIPGSGVPTKNEAQPTSSPVLAATGNKQTTARPLPTPTMAPPANAHPTTHTVSVPPPTERWWRLGLAILGVASIATMTVELLLHI